MTVIYLHERRKERQASFDTEFPEPADRALIGIHEFVRLELDANPADEWSDYHAGAAHDYVDSLERRFRDWSDRWDER